ncbi:acyl transferase 15 [Setaria italica]|uniref:acyl transferase 15 n=1 Tax=Setaria italica TaxID=4555 RepID=UPI0003512EAD|nr:acyl transferase 15 [Setaria italica]XP_034580906.1 acyl transferase 15-like [Setaria viridis]
MAAWERGRRQRSLTAELLLAAAVLELPAPELLYLDPPSPAEGMRGRAAPVGEGKERVDGADADEFYIRCTDEGAEVVAASANCALKEVKSFDKTLLAKLTVDSPHQGHHATYPLLSLQVTEFSCGGFILAVTWNHAIADGVGIAQLIGALGELARGLSSPSIVPVRWDDSVSSWSPPFNEMQQTMSPEPLALVPLDIAIPLSTINRIKAKFCSYFSGQQCTMFEVVIAILWQCRTRATVSNPETQVFISFVADVRKHVGAKDGYYGNCLTDHVVKATSNMVANTDIMNLVMMIKHAKDQIPNKFKKNASNDSNQLQGLDGPYNKLHLSSWRNIGFDEVDFGSGAMWTMWKARNNIVFDDKMVKAPEMMVYKLLALLTYWKPLLKQKESEKVEVMIGKLTLECCKLTA